MFHTCIKVPGTPPSSVVYVVFRVVQRVIRVILFPLVVGAHCVAVRTRPGKGRWLERVERDGEGGGIIRMGLESCGKGGVGWGGRGLDFSWLLDGWDKSRVYFVDGEGSVSQQGQMFTKLGKVPTTQNYL